MPVMANAFVSPAGAGMDPISGGCRLMSFSFPRRRGDGPVEKLLDTWPDPFPPQARGWTSHSSDECAVSLVSPAGAGMDPNGYCPGQSLPGFPRRRGDGPSTMERSSPVGAFPPQARGWTR